MPAKTLLFHDDGRARLCADLDILANAVKVTLGPRGRTVMLDRPVGPPTVVNSGVIVAREIELPDKFENVGARMVREVASKTSEMAGEGTTTVTVLAQASVQQGMKFVTAGLDPMDCRGTVKSSARTAQKTRRELGRAICTASAFAFDRARTGFFGSASLRVKEAVEAAQALNTAIEQAIKQTMVSPAFQAITRSASPIGAKLYD